MEGISEFDMDADGVKEPSSKNEDVGEKLSSEGDDDVISSTGLEVGFSVGWRF